MFNRQHKEENDESPVLEKSQPSKLVAKKDFVIHCNDDYIEIKKGEVVSCPKKYLVNLKTEGVI